MSITRLVAEDFRNLQGVDFRPARTVNLISGDNGSGKTSILEVIYTLATGRSFRTRKFKNLIDYQSRAFQVFAELDLQGLTRRLGVARGKDGSSLFKLDGEPVSSAGELATVLPCQVINSRSFELLEGGPSERRAYLDWLVFHVKPGFRKSWSEYSRCLKQRNAMLRSEGIPRADFAVWNQSLARLGEEIDSYRQQMVLDLLPLIKRYLGECEFVEAGEFGVRYVPGWEEGQSLLVQLEEHHQRDVALGYTSLGPHRSDIRFTFNRKPVVELFSRGQQKAVVAALYLAQLNAFGCYSENRQCVLLLDDLPAELDQHNIQRLCRWIQELPDIQVFITGIDLTKINDLWLVTAVNDESFKTFHVKQGQVQEQPSQWSKA